MRLAGKKLVVLFILLAASSLLVAEQGGPSSRGMAWADSSDIIFNWVEIFGDPDAVELSNQLEDDTVYTVALPSDFDFEYYGQEFDTLYISENGYVTFRDYGLTSDPSNNDLSENALVDSVLAVFWDTLGITLSAGVYYKMDGIAPYRRAIVEYHRLNIFGDGNALTFQIVLFETTNLIKYQYLQMGDNASEDLGGGATIGLKYGGATYFDSLAYSVDSVALSDGLPILFYPSDTLNASSSLSPAIVAPGITPQSFSLSITSIGFNQLADSLEHMGKADVVRISNEVNTASTDPISVTSIVVDGEPFFTLEFDGAPADLGLEGPFATWFYDNALDSLYIRTSQFAIRDSIQIEFQQNTPSTPGTISYDGHIYAALEFEQNTTIHVEATVAASDVDYYTFQPVADSTILAGDTLAFTITARDEFGNPVTNSETINLTTIGSSSASFFPSSSVTFAASSTVSVSVTDTVEGSFVVEAENAVDTTANGVSGEISITPGALAELRIRSAAGNQGTELDTVQQSLTTLESVQMYAAGYDAYGNYIADIDSAVWDQVGGGDLVNNSPYEFPHTGSDLFFDCDSAPRAGLIFVSLASTPGITDTTDTVSVSFGPLSYILIQADETDPNSEIGDTTLTAGEVIRFYSVSYDIHGNRRISISSNWSMNNPGLGSFDDSTSRDNVFFTAVEAETGVLTAKSVPDSTILDRTGLITILPAAIDSLVIRDGANNGGNPYNSPLTISTDTSIVLYAAGYDSLGNFVADTSVSWAASGLSNVPAGPSASIVFEPSTVESGTISTNATSVTNDTTGTITVNTGALAEMRIEDQPDGTGSEIESISMVAGDDTTFYSVGYDADGNFISGRDANWTLEGDAIGSFSQSNPDSFNVLTAITSGTAVVRATDDAVPSLSDITSSITVGAGTPSTLVYVAESDSQSAPVGGQLPRDIEVQVLDVLSNPVIGTTVTFDPVGGGSVSQATATTNGLGFASTRWTVHADTSMDTLAVYIAGTTTTPDTINYVAFVTSGAADTLFAVGATADTGVVNTDVAEFRIAVQDSDAIGVPDIPVSFSIIQSPDGSADDSLSVYSATTDASGEATTTLYLGRKTGIYRVRAFTSTTTPNFVDFVGTAEAGAVDSILILAGNNQTGTVGQALSDSISVRAVDQFENAIPNSSMIFNPEEGSALPVSGVSDETGILKTEWTLGDVVGSNRMVATVALSLVRSDTIRATGTAAGVDTLILVSLRQASNDSIAAIAGENVSVVLEAQDSLGNVVAGVDVDFAGLAGYAPIFEASQLTTGTDGRVTNVVKTDLDTTETFFSASVSGGPTRELHVYHIRYDQNSLTPVIASPGDTLQFQLDLINPSPYDVELDTALTNLEFDDGGSFFDAALNGATSTLSAGSTTTITFDSTQIDSNMANTGYMPELVVRGAGSDEALTGSLFAENDAFSLFTVEVVEVVGPVDSTYSPGEDFRVTISVNNAGPDTIRVDSLVMVSSKIPVDSFQTVLTLPNPTELFPNSGANLFRFDAHVPIDAAIGLDTIDAKFFGKTSNGTTVLDAEAASTYTFAVVSNAAITLQNLTPTTVTNGDSITITSTVLNQGGVAVTLNQDSSYVVFGTDTLRLSQVSTIPPNSDGSVDIDFGPELVASSASAYSATARYYGLANNAEFDTTITSAATITVQNPPSLVVSLLNVVPATAVQNEDSIQTLVQLTNSGTSNAPAVLSAASDIRLTTLEDGFENIQPSEVSQALFPITISGDGSTIIEFYHSLDDDYRLGVDTARISYEYSDQNSGMEYSAAPIDTFDTYTVISPAGLEITSVISAFDSVSIGSEGVGVSMRVANTGGSDLVLDSLQLSFTAGSYLFTDTTFVTPETLAASSATTFNFNVTVPSPQASQAQVVIDALANGRYGSAFDVPVADVDADTVAVWQLVSPAQFSWGAIAPDTVSNGQSVGFAVTVSNSGEANVYLDADSTTLLIDDGVQTLQTDLASALDSLLISGGATETLTFQSLTADNYIPGTLNQELQIRNFLENGFRNSDTLTASDLVVFDSTLVAIDTIIAADTISQDMNYTMDILLTNAGASNAEALVDSIIISTFGISQTLDSVIVADDTITIQLREFITNASSGTVAYTVDVYWRDRYLNNSNITSRANSVEVLESAAIQITNIDNPGNINTGQSGIEVTISVQNTGSVTAELDTITFDPQVGLYAFQLPGTLQSIAPGATEDFVINVSVFPNSGTGVDSIGVLVSARDSISQNVTQAADTFNWSIEGQADVDILSVRPGQSQISRGQTSIPVDVIFNNPGSVDVRIDSVQLLFDALGDSNYVGFTLGGGNLLTLSAGLQDTLQLSVDVNSDALLGTEILNARAEGVDLFTLGSITVEDANIKGGWEVQQRPVIETPEITLTADTVSTGQTGLILSFQLTNNGGADPTATATLDSIQLTVNGVADDSTDLSFTAQFSTPVTLINNATLTFNYAIDVQDTAASGSYELGIASDYSDANDGSGFAFASPDSVNPELVVQQVSALSVRRILFEPDTAYLGLNNVEMTITAANDGEGSADLNATTPQLEISTFPVSLDTLGFPFTLDAGDSIDIRYQVNVPDNLVFTDLDTISAGAVLQWIDNNSNQTISTDTPVSTAGNLYVTTPAALTFNNLTPVGPFDIGQNVTFTMSVTNSGSTNLVLDENTRMRWDKVGSPGTSIYIDLDTLATDLSVLGGETQDLVFAETPLSESGDFQIYLEVRGTVYDEPFPDQDLDTGVFENVGGTLFISSMDIAPDPAAPGDQGITVDVAVQNASSPVTIDSLESGLTFRYDTGDLLNVAPLRIDTLTSVDFSDTLRWVFDLPGDATPGTVNVTASLSFNSGTIGPISAVQSFDISSGVRIVYVDSSLAPNTVVQGQSVQFVADFVNLGSSNLLVDADGSFMEFTDGTRTFNANVSGSFALPGFDGEADTSQIVFETTDIDSVFDPGDYVSTFRIFGELPNSDTLTALDSTTLTNQLSVLLDADILVDSINVVPETIVAGQEGVEVLYYLSNQGESAATISDANSAFSDDNDVSVDDNWIEVTSSKSFPFTLAALDTAVIARRFNVSQASDAGLVRARVSVDYADVEKQGASVSFSDSTIYDSLTIISPSVLTTDSLILTNTANAGNGTVNANQAYDLRTLFSNAGGDAVTGLILELYENNSLIESDTLGTIIAANSTLDTVLYSGLTNALADDYGYRLVLTGASSATSGESVLIGPPLDNLETVTVQDATILALAAAADVSNVAQGQEFTVSFDVSRDSGSSPFGDGRLQIVLPDGYSLGGSGIDSLAIDEGTLSDAWTVVADSVSASTDQDTIQVSYQRIPLDLNIDDLVGILDTTVNVLVHTDSSAGITSQLAIDAPIGAQDSVVSSGQSFDLSNEITFLGGIDTLNRSTEIILPPNYSVNGSRVLDLSDSSSTADVFWTVNVPSSVTSGEMDTIQVVTTGLDANLLTEISVTQELPITVLSAANLAISAQLTSPPGAGDAVLSTDQSFVWALSLANLGDAGVDLLDSTAVEIDLSGEGVYFDEDLLVQVDTIRFIPDAVVDVTLYTDSLPGVSALQANVFEISNDENTGTDAEINSITIEQVIEVIERADLRVTLDGPSAVASSTGPFQVTATVENIGDALISPNSVEVVLDTAGSSGLVFLSGNDTATVALNGSGVGTVNYSFDTQGVSVDNQLSVSIAGDVAVDENTNLPAFKSQDSDSILIDVVSDILQVTSFEIISPAGAIDSVVSTGQDFVVELGYFYSSAIDSSGRRAYLAMPSGYSVAPDTFPLVDDFVGTVTFVVTAPDTAASPADILATIAATAGSSTVEDQALLTVETVEQAEINVAAVITNPNGALDAEVSTSQWVELEFTVDNSGTAATQSGSTNEVAIALPTGFQFADSTQADTVFVLTGDTDTLLVQAPATAAPQRQIDFDVLTAAIDENTGEEAQLGDGSDEVGITTVDRADLQISLSADTVLSTNQDSVALNVAISNIGTASIVPDSVQVGLSINPIELAFLAGENDSPYVQLIDGNGELTVYLRALSVVDTSRIYGSIIDTVAQDENDNWPDTLATISRADTSLVMNIAEGGSITIDSIYVTAPEGGMDNTLSGGQAFTLKAEVTFAGNVAADERLGEVSLPPGFFLPADTASKPISAADTISWQIQISDSVAAAIIADDTPEMLETGKANTPASGDVKSNVKSRQPVAGEAVSVKSQTVVNTTTNEDMLAKLNEAISGDQPRLGVDRDITVRASGKDGSTGANLSDVDALTVHVQGQPQLYPIAAITAPAGALDGEVSTDQIVEFAVAIDNNGEAGTVGLNKIDVTVPSGFVIEGSPTPEQISVYAETGIATTIRVMTPASASPFQQFISVVLDTAAIDTNSGTFAAIEDDETNIALTLVEKASLRLENVVATPDTIGFDQEFTVSATVTNVGEAGVGPDSTVWIELDVDTSEFEFIGLLADTIQSVQLDPTATVTWQLASKSNVMSTHLVAHILPDRSFDENDFEDEPIHLANGVDSAAIEVISDGTIEIGVPWFQANGTNSLTASTNQIDALVIRPQFTGLFTDTTATLTLPEVFGTDPITRPFDGDSAQWIIQMPGTATDEFVELEIVASGTSITGRVLRDTAYAYIDIDRATQLVLNGGITLGAVDNTVSFGQTFTYEATVQNLGEAPLDPGSAAQLTLDLGNNLLLEEGDAVTDFTLDTPVSWVIKTDTSSVVAALAGRIDVLRQQRESLIREVQVVAVNDGDVSVAGSRSSAGTARGPATSKGSTSSASKTTDAISQIQTAKDLPGEVFHQTSEIDLELSTLYGELSSLLDTSSVKVHISSVPADINSGLPADTAGFGEVNTPVYIAAYPEIEIISSEYLQTVSTSQVSTLTVTLDAPSNVINRVATITLPEDFVTLEDPVRPIGSEATASWTIFAPSSIESQLDENIEVGVMGVDQYNNTVEVEDMIQLPVTVQQAPTVDIQLDGNAVRQVPKGEAFKVKAIVSRGGEADITGDLQVILQNTNSEFQVLDSDTVILSSLDSPVEVNWDLIAPESNTSSTALRITFGALPTDVNSGQDVSLTNDELNVFVSVIANQLLVDTFAVSEEFGNYLKGSSDIPVFGLSFENPDPAKDVFINGLTISARSNIGDTLLADIENLISRMRVVSYDYFNMSLGKQNVVNVFGEVDIMPGDNPIDMRFNFAQDTVLAQEIDSLVVLLDLTDESINRTFQLRIDEVDAIDDDSVRVSVVDENGAPISSLGEMFTGPPVTIQSSDPADLFHNYPNPFGLNTQVPGQSAGTTFFVFHLAQESDVQLRIYTLLGNLVFMGESVTLGAGTHDRGPIRWDGLNGQGQRVVNGVYVAVLRVTGGDSKTLQTKVVYIK